MLLFIVLGCSACGIKLNDSLLESNDNEISREDSSKENESNQGNSKEDDNIQTKEYVIHYDLGELKTDSYIVFAVKSKTVVANSDFVLDQPSCYGYIFQEWKFVNNGQYCKNGIYMWESDIYLIAEWRNADYSDRWWTPVL